MTALAARIRTGDRREVLATAGYAVLLVACAVLSLAWLVVGAVVGVVAQNPAVAAALTTAAAEGDRWARGILEALPHSGPPAQGVLDYGFSLLTLVIAALLLAGRRGSWSIRLLVLAMVGSAGAFNLQAHASATAVETAVGLEIGGLHQVLLHGVACAAYIVALMVFPPDREAHPGGAARTALIVAGVGTLLLVGFGTALLPHTLSCVLFFGFLVPVVGLAVLPRQIRGALTATARTQARLLFSVLAADFAIAVVLAVITLLLWTTGWTQVVLVDPTANPGEPGSGEPTALLFWFSRLACIAIAGAVFVATRRGGLWTAERLLSSGLAAGLTAALVGGGYVVVRRTAAFLLADDASAVAAVLATGVAALAFLPVYVRAERLADRLLYGSRPTPYSVLAGVTALSRGTATDAPDLMRVAEAVGRGLGATTCRLTVTRPGLRDRVHTWSEGEAHDPEDLVEVVVRHGTEAVGTLAVDYAAVAGPHRRREQLLEDVADSLGVVLQASRYGIELERQLRAALAHAGEIAASRRAVVAEMDRERRRIERDLHDGAQHHLVSLRLTLGLVEHQVSTAQYGSARARLEQVADQIDVAESILAETAMGVASPLLAELGLVRALEKELAGGQPPVPVDVQDVPVSDPFPPDVEAAVYFCCLEAVNNARKHAPGAAVGVRLATEDGRLRFVVRDDGPGWDQSDATRSAGRGLRNVTARIAAVGGSVEVRSAPGTGTTVEGSVPLPQPEAAPRTEAAATAGVRQVLGAPAVAAVAAPLVDQVRDAVRAARELYHRTPHAHSVRVLAERLEGPLPVAVVGTPGSGATALAQALDTPAAALTVVEDPPTEPDGGADAIVLVLRREQLGGAPLLPGRVGGPAPRPAHVIGVLALDGPVDEAAQQAAAECAARPQVRRRCHVVVPVAPALARAGALLTEEEDRVLRVWAQQGAPRAGVVVPAAAGPAVTGDVLGDDPGEAELRDRFGPAVLQTAVAAIRSGEAPTRDTLAAALIACSGLPRLRELVTARLIGRADGLTAPSVLSALEALVRTDPPPEGGDRLRYQLDRVRSGAHELTELEMVDALHAGELDVPATWRRDAERLLGASGTDPWSRLGLAPDADRKELRRAAADQLVIWQRRTEQPVAGSGGRTVAAALVQTCERLVARTAGT